MIPFSNIIKTGPKLKTYKTKTTPTQTMKAVKPPECFVSSLVSAGSSIKQTPVWSRLGGTRRAFGFKLSVHGTVLVAGSLQGPTRLLAPVARTRTHSLAPLVRPGIVSLDLLAVLLNTQLVPETGSVLVQIS